MRSFTRRRLVIVAAMMVAAGCSAATIDGQSERPQTSAGGTESSLAGSGANSPPNGGSYLPEQQPIYAAVYGRLGISSTELHERVQARRAEAFVVCMSDRGYSVTIELASQAVRLPRPDFSPVDTAIEEVKATDSMNGTKLDERAAIECYEEVNSIDPFNVLFELVDDAEIEVSDRVKTDDRYRAAVDSRESCELNANGLDSDRERVQTQVQSIMLAYHNGETPAANALDQLNELRPVAGAIDWTTDGGCDADAYAVERSLVAEYQQQYLDDHPGFVDGLVEQFEPAVQTFLDEG